MTKLKKHIERIMGHRYADEIIAAVIIINAMTLFLSTIEYFDRHYALLLERIDQIAIVFFTVEIIFRMVIQSKKFFRNSWNWIDMIIVIISILPHAGYFTALRTIRILRVVRLIRFLPKMRFLIASIVHAIPGIVSISAFLFLFFFVFSIMAFNLFKSLHSEYFNYISTTMFTMFQLLMNEGWSVIVRPIMDKVPYSYLFFVSYTIVMKFTLLNLFFGLIVNSMQAGARRGNKLDVDRVISSNIEMEELLESKIQLLSEDIKSLRLLIEKKHKS